MIYNYKYLSLYSFYVLLIIIIIKLIVSSFSEYQPEEVEIDLPLLVDPSNTFFLE